MLGHMFLYNSKRNGIGTHQVKQNLQGMLSVVVCVQICTYNLHQYRPVRYTSKIAL